MRRYGHFDECEDAVQEALVAAAVQWPVEGRPDQPEGLAADRRRSPPGQPAAQRRRRAGAGSRREAVLASDVAGDPAPSGDDTLTLLFLCCHPALSPDRRRLP